MSVPREAFAAITRQVIEHHAEWDSPHCFMTLHRDGEELACRTFACIMPDMNPADYPRIMAKIASEQHEKDPADPAYGYLLQIEAHGVQDPGPAATEDERERFRADRIGRTFRQRPDAVESAVAWCADIHGRVWTAAKVRGKDGISESFYPPGKAPGGQLIRGLLAVAYATGMASHGLPPPAWQN